MSSSDYKQAYESAKQELADMIAAQDKLGKRIVVLRESVRMLATLCESEEIAVQPSAEAAYLLDTASLAQEIQAVLQAQWPLWQRPSEVRGRLERLGCDLSKYTNPQAAIHMVLKRMVESKDAQEDTSDEDGKQMYRFPPMWQSIADKSLAKPRGGYKGGGYKKVRE